MSFDFFPEEQAQTLNKAARMPSLTPEPGIWDNFVPGAGKVAMQGFAITARAIDLAGAPFAMLEDKLSGGTTEQDKYFKEHDDVFNRAVDYWTPKPGEVGTAGRVVGSLASALPVAMISPALLAIGVGEGTAEDLIRQNVDLSKAVGAGLVSGVATGLGINIPFLGKTLAAKIATGAAGNVALGIGERAAERKILEGTEAGKQYNPWDKESIVLDTLMGLGFGVVAHITSPTDRAAILTANQARHIEDTTAPGVPIDAAAQTAHTDAIKHGIDDLLNGRAANVEQSLQGVEFKDNDAKVAAQQEVMASVKEQARQTVVETILQNEALRIADETPGFLRTPEQLLALKEGQPAAEGAPELARAIEIANKPAFLRTPEEKIALEAALKGNAFDALTTEIPAPTFKPVDEGKPAIVLPDGAQAKPIDPVIAEAQARIAANPDLVVHAGTDVDGKPITKPLSEVLSAASEDVAKAKASGNLFTEAARCLLGAL